LRPNRQQLVQLIKNGFVASFLDEASKLRYTLI